MHARRTWRNSQRPQLTARVHDIKGLPLLLKVRNIGGGPAKMVSFQVVIDRHRTKGHLPPDGFLAPEQSVSLEMNFPPNADPNDAQYALMCLDRENDIYAWSRDEKTRRQMRRRWTKVRTIGWMFEKLYGRGTDRDLVNVSWKASDRDQ